MSRRGEISMEVIIIAAIALLILVVLSFLIIKQTGNISEGTTCAGGTCRAECESNEIRNLADSCSNEGDVCCVPLGKGDS